MNPFAQLATPIIRRPGDFIPEEVTPKASPKPKVTRRVRMKVEPEAKMPTSRGLYPVTANPWDLTPTECQVLRLIVAGKNQAEIGRDMGRSRKTVNTHAERLKEKMEALTMAHAAVLWDRHQRG